MGFMGAMGDAAFVAGRIVRFVAGGRMGMSLGGAGKCAAAGKE
jgi:hypothetical protein